jgi:hypothetical protein
MVKTHGAALVIAVGAACISCSTDTNAHSEQPQSSLKTSIEGSPEATARLTWKMITTECAVPGSGASATFWLSVDHNQGVEALSLRTLLEFRDATIMPTKAEVVSEADKLNGVEWRGTSYLRASAHRIKQFEGPSRVFGQDHPMSNDPWSAWEDGGGILMQMIKDKGKWTIDYRFADSPTPRFGLFSSREPDADSRDKLSCAKLTAPDPFADFAAAIQAARGEVAPLTGIRFSVFDDYETLQAKANKLDNALDKTRFSENRELSGYLQNKVYYSLHLHEHTQPEPMEVRVLGDIPSLIGVDPLDRTMAFRDAHGVCRPISPQDQKTLKERNDELTAILRLVGLTMEKTAPPNLPEYGPCDQASQ